MELSPDLNELLRLFHSHGVESVVVGAHALAHHGAPRFTGDLDLFVAPTRENATKILGSLEAFGFGGLGLNVDDFSTPDQVIQLGTPPSRVDILTSLSGVSWETARATAVHTQFGDIPVLVLGRDELIANKRATGRLKDQADLEAIGE